MVSSASRKVGQRQSAAQRVQAAFAAKMSAVTAGVEAAEKAYAARQKSMQEADAADDALRAAVATLVDAEQSLEDIAALTGLPISDVRAARRPKQRTDDEPEEPAPAAGRRGRVPAVGVPPKPPTRPALVGGEGDDDQVPGEGTTDGENTADPSPGELAAAG